MGFFLCNFHELKSCRISALKFCFKLAVSVPPYLFVSFHSTTYPKLLCIDACMTCFLVSGEDEGFFALLVVLVGGL